jgi:hypothetical protein
MQANIVNPFLFFSYCFKLHVDSQPIKKSYPKNNQHRAVNKIINPVQIQI